MSLVDCRHPAAPPSGAAPAPQSLGEAKAPWIFNLDVARFGVIFAFVVALVYIALLFSSVHYSPVLSSFSSDETLIYYQAARNFNQYGFLNSMLLQDFSTSSLASDHPYVYNHMASGPEITVALLTRVVGENYAAVRLFFGTTFLIGLYFYIRFAGMLLGNLGLAGAGFTLFFLDPYVIMHWIEHPGLATFLFFAFFPLVAMERWRTTGRRGHLWASLGVVLASTFFIFYQLVILLGVAWFFLWTFGLMRLRKRELFGFYFAAGLGIALHIVQNMCFLGVHTALEEILLTLSNRATGHPTGPELVEYYQNLNVVHHGVHQFNAVKLATALFRCFNPMALLAVALAGPLCLTLLFLRGRRSHEASAPQDPATRSITGLLRLGLWIIPTVALPVLVFPAYSGDYNLQGCGHLFAAIACVALMNFTFRQLKDAYVKRASAAPLGPRLSLSWANLCIGLALGTIVLFIGYRQYREFGITRKIAVNNQYGFMTKLREHVEGKVIMTNLYPPVAGFFTREAVYGVAELDAVPEEGPLNPAGAYSKFLRDYTPEGRPAPTHYVFCKALLPGYAQSIYPEKRQRLYDRLATRFAIVYEDPVVTIFDLRQSESATAQRARTASDVPALSPVTILSGR